MFLRASLLLPAVLAVALAGIAYGNPGGSTDMDQTKAADWDCSPEQLIVGYFHCAPPGKPSVQDMINGDTSAPSIVLRVFNPDGSFAGTEMLRRADLHQVHQACPQDGLAQWGLLPFGYYACHHFETGA